MVRFCNEYLVDFNATRAAIVAGYSKNCASSSASRLMTRTDVQEYLGGVIKGLNTKNKIDAEKLQEYLASVICGESESEVVVVVGSGDGYSEAKHVTKKPDEDQKLKAAGIAAKILNLGNPKVDINTNIPIIICGENDIKD